MSVPRNLINPRARRPRSLPTAGQVLRCRERLLRSAECRFAHWMARGGPMANDRDLTRLEADFFRRGDELGNDPVENLDDLTAGPAREPTPPERAAPAAAPLAPEPLRAKPSASPPPSPRPNAALAPKSTAAGKLLAVGTVAVALLVLALALATGDEGDALGRVAAHDAAIAAAAARHCADARTAAASSSARERAAAAEPARAKPKRAPKRARRKQPGRRRSTADRRTASATSRHGKVTARYSGRQAAAVAPASRRSSAHNFWTGQDRSPAVGRRVW